MTVRVAAARVLLAVDDGTATLAAALERERHAFADGRDRALLGEIVTGTLRWRNELDALIVSASQRAVGQIDHRALAVLRVAAYQLRHLTRVPAHAVVHESVAAARTLKASRAAGFVNAVLRGLLRQKNQAVLPPRPGPDATRQAQVDYLSITLSHPAWLVERWITRYGFAATETWCQFNNTTPHVTVRPVTPDGAGALIERLREDGTDARPATHVSDAITLPPGALGRLSADVREQITIQDEGAQLIGRVAGAAAGERVLDLCAAPGGKTLVYAADMHRGAGQTRASLIVAADYRPARVRLLRETLAQTRCDVAVVRLDARESLPFRDTFDCVVLDAPCSGLGTLRRDPDLKWTRRPEDLARLSAEESVMIARAAEAVRPGGRLVYATCSSEPEENGDVVDAFLRTVPLFSRVAADARLPAARGMVNDAGDVATLPFRDGLDAFFAAVLVRQGTA
ncbi:MAG: transcription antitermination factor NusB [Vicinamibacterales bacterium]